MASVGAVLRRLAPAVKLSVPVAEGTCASPPALIAQSTASIAIRRYVVHFPPVMVTSPESDNITACSRESLAVCSPALPRKSGRRPAKMLRTSPRRGRAR